MTRSSRRSPSENVSFMEPEKRMETVSLSDFDALRHELELRYRCLTNGLQNLTAQIAGASFEPGVSRPEIDLVKNADTAEVIRRMIVARRQRSRSFPSDLFADPAWDMLLDLYLAQLEQRRTVVSSLCLAADVPATTALRWITTLIERGLLFRRPDKIDRRRVFVELTELASEGMRSYLIQCEAPPSIRKVVNIR